LSIYRKSDEKIKVSLKSDKNDGTLHEDPGTRWSSWLRHKPEGRGFDFRWCQWNSSLT